VEDFELLRRSHTKILSISTFSWLAGWLGTGGSNVIMPVAGLFNPEACPDHNFLPVDDGRYAFRQFSPMIRDREEPDLFQFLDTLAAASAGYPLIEPSTDPIQGASPSGPNGSSMPVAMPQTAEEWSNFAESIILNRDGQ
jgi:hypothetical protein